MRPIVLFVFLSCGLRLGAAVPDDGFENWAEGRPVGWNRLWARDPRAGELLPDASVKHAGERAAKVTHRGDKDWSLNASAAVPANAGDIFEVKAWLKIEGVGRAIATAAAVAADGKTVDWSLGGEELAGPRDWVLSSSRLVIPAGVVRLTPRVIGTGPATVWFDDYQLVKVGNLDEMRSKNLPGHIGISNAFLRVTLNTGTGAITVEDRRKASPITQAPVAGIVVKDAAADGPSALRIAAYDPLNTMDVDIRMAMDLEKPEFTIEINGGGRMRRAIAFPGPFMSARGTHLVVPMNEGISYPVDDATIEPSRLVAYGGHGICMAFWGVTDGESGHMAILETADDAAIRISRRDGLLCVAPEWEPQRGNFGYARRLRYVFFDNGGHVAICKHYRAHARAASLIKTLEEKKREVAAVDLLIGAANVWCWEKDAVGIARQLKDAGIDRILWSNRGTPESIAAMNQMGGILTSRYDIYQDLMDPGLIESGLIRGRHSDWTQGAWPKDIMIGPDGKWIPGWRVKGTDGVMHPCAVLCDSRAVNYARERVPADLKEHPYRARFIDTTTASPWRECYHSDHPMTRTQSREWKMRLLGYMSGDMKLVTGCETGHEASVPFLHYFEGMLSLGPYRVPDAGRQTSRIWDEVPERVAKFQVGHRYRLPLWELVYHDCTVAQWYWGDYNNKLPAIWRKRDLFNALYGTPPMFMFNRTLWNERRERFAESYRATCPIARATGYSEMIDHRFLTADRDVQQTRFANGVTVTVNFSDAPRHIEGVGDMAPMSVTTQGM